MTTFDLFGGGLTVREELHSFITGAWDNYLQEQNFAIQADEFCSVYNLVGLDGTIDGQGLQVSSYYNDSTAMDVPSGGSYFLWDSTKAKSSHNGVTVISPTVPWAGTQATLSAFIAGTGETDSSGNGCWVRQYNQLDVMMGGAVSDGATSDLVAFQAVVNALPDSGTHVIHVPAGSYAGALSSLSLGNRKIVWLEKGAVTYVTSSPAGFRSPDSADYLNSVARMVGFSGTTTGQRVDVASYYTWSVFSAKHKGGGTFFWSNTLAKSNHNGITIISPTVPWDGTSATVAAYRAKTGETDPSGSGCWTRQFTELDIYMAGAVGGLTGFDNAPVIEECLAIDTASGMTVVCIPEATFYVNSTIEFPSGKNDRTLRGVGSGSLLYRDGDYGDTFSIHGNNTTGTQLFRPTVKDLRISSNALTTSGSHFNLEGIDGITLDNLHLTNGFKFFTFNGVTGNVSRIYGNLSNIYGGSVTGRKFMEFGDAAATYAHPSCADLFMRDINGRGPSSGSGLYEYTFDFSSADGVWIIGGHSGYATATGATVRFNPTGSQSIGLIWFGDFMFDETDGYSAYFDGSTTGVYTNINFDNCNLKGGGTNTQSGFATSATCNAFGVYVNGGSIIQHAKHGVEINSPDFRNIHFNGVDVRGNSKSSTNTYSGYKFANSTRDIYVDGGASGGDDNSATDADSQKYGIEGGTGHSNIIFRGVDLRKNLTNPININPGNGIQLINCPTGAGIVSSTNTTEIVGYHKTIPDSGGVVRQLQIISDQAGAGAVIARYTNDALPSTLAIMKSKGAIGAHGSALASGEDIGRISFEASDGTNFIRGAYILAEADGTSGTNDMPTRVSIYTCPDGSATATEKIRIGNQGFTQITGSLGLGAPVTKTGDFTVADIENFLINNKAGSACVVTLPAAASYSGRIITILNYQAQTVDSASSNVVPITGGAAGTAIIAATAGKWVRLVSDGANWLIVEAN